MIIIANWKAKVGSIADAKKLIVASKKIADARVHQVIVAPGAPYLGLFSVDNKSKLQFAAQDITLTDGGAQTGEVTGAMLATVKTKYVIIGHSERRALGDTDADVLTKIKHSLSSGLIPIVCVGEKERDAEAQYLSLLRAQIDSIYTGTQAKQHDSIILAYEPIWAIGKSASEGITPDDLTEMIQYIRKVLSTYLPAKKVEKAAILYGGAVEPSNAKALARNTGVDGLLVGHASTDAKLFTALVKALL
jgi:triosephosphate isomerase (TIM)